MNELLTFAGGAVIGALVSWFISHQYYLKASADQRAEMEKLSESLKPHNTLRDFERLLETSRWSKSVIGRTEVWMADADNTFQIEQGEQTREFEEPWTTTYPDPKSSAYPVYLKINGTIIKELTFISMDGGRIFVPMAQVRSVNEGTVDYFWSMDSIEVRVCRVIGTYYLYENLEGVAWKSKISLSNDDA